MGLLGDISSKVITYYSANADEHIGELKKLKKNITEAQKAELEGHEARKGVYDDWQKNLTGVNQGLELVGKAVALGKEAFKSYADNLRLQAAAGTTSIAGLQAASLGLRTEHELLTFAAKAQGGAFKLTQAEMEMTQKAMIGLTRAGFDQEEVTKKVTDAIVKLQGDGLKDLGIQVKQGTNDTEKFANIMEALGEKAKGVNSGTLTAAEGIQTMGTSMGDSVDHMKQAIGELVIAMGPLLDALARAVEFIAMAARTAGGPNPEKVKNLIRSEAKKNPGGNFAFLLNSAGYKQPGTETPTRAADQFGAGNGAGTFDEATWLSQQWMIANPLSKKNGLDTFLDGLDPYKTPSGSFDEGAYATFMRKRGLMGDQGKESKPLDWGNWGSMGAASSADGIVSEVADKLADAIARAAGVGVETYAKGSATANTDTGNVQPDGFDGFDIGSRITAAAPKGGFAERYGKQQSFLEGHFGKLEDFDAYATAFSMLSGSVTAAMDAWIDGSMGAGEAIKKFLAGAMKGLATSMAVEALKHGAYAIGSLAFGDVRGAATHGAAAAAFGAGAAAAAVAAKELGGGGGAKGGSSGGGAGGSSGSTLAGSITSRGQDQAEKNKSTAPIVVVLGSSFDKTTPRERARSAQDALNAAMRERDE